MSGAKLLPIFLILTCGVLTFHFSSRIAVAEPKNSKAPSFTLTPLNGGELKSSELKGKVVVLKFVASY
jgi:hypothetical protein